jgi:glucose-6-phosphate-specific signal transduction histidine kinase
VDVPLTYRTASPDVIDCIDYLRHLCREMEESLSSSGGRVAVEVDPEEEGAGLRTLFCPSASSWEHAFPEGREGRVRVELRAEDGGTMRLLVEDDGVGMPAERRAGSLGLRLVEMFAKQVKGGGVMEAGRRGQGTAVLVTPGPEQQTAPPGTIRLARRRTVPRSVRQNRQSAVAAKLGRRTAHQPGPR